MYRYASRPAVTGRQVTAVCVVLKRCTFAIHDTSLFRIYLLARGSIFILHKSYYVEASDDDLMKISATLT